MAAGCDDFIRKPYQVTEIFQCLTKHLGVRYITTSETVTAWDKAPVDPPILASLPDPLICELEQVLLRLDIDAIEAMIDRVRRYNEDLADALTALAKKFQYGKILHMIEAYRSKSKLEEHT